MTRKSRLNAVRRARRHLHAASGYNPDGGHYTEVDDALDLLEKEFLPPKLPGVPALGGCVVEEADDHYGRSILLEDCTHLTDGLNRPPGTGLWPAFDTAFNHVGRAVIAPEALVITDNTSGSQGGDAFYARGASGIEYWFGHITSVPAQGARFRKGAKLTTISSDHRVPHLHLAINATRLLGHHLVSHDDYTHGAPKIGVQLAGAKDV